jgi:16S rRNA processing protein RimM
VADEPDDPTPARDVVIARIIKARGIKGEVACDLMTDFPERFAAMDRVCVRRLDGTILDLRLEDHWFHKNRVILKFEGYDSMTSAKDLASAVIVIPEQDPGLLEDGEFYETGIVGADIVSVAGEELGKVVRVMRTGGTDLLVVDGKEGREHLIPFAEGICTEVDLEARRIRVNLPDGLLDL